MTIGDYGEAVILGIVQGIAEFLPISSSGHLVIIGEIIRNLTGREIDPEANVQLIVALHAGTLLSILVVYRNRLLGLLRERWVLAGIVIATLPLVIIAPTPIKDFLEEGMATPMVAGCCLLLTAFLLLVSRSMERGERSLEQITPLHAWLIGLFQLLAILPGVSRSGSTISGGLILGYTREAAANFSFFIAIPAILGATVLKAADMFGGETTGANFPIGPLLVGTAVSFIVGWLTLSWLLSIIARGRLHWFAIYCTIVGIATITWQLVA